MRARAAHLSCLSHQSYEQLPHWESMRRSSVPAPVASGEWTGGPYMTSETFLIARLPYTVSKPDPKKKSLSAIIGAQVRISLFQMYYGKLEMLKCMHKYFQDFPRSRYVLRDHHFIGLFWVLTRIRKSHPETLFHSISPHFFGDDKKCHSIIQSYSGCFGKGCRYAMGPCVLRIHHFWPASFRFSCFAVLYDFLLGPS
jgi:hypothetical protein